MLDRPLLSCFLPHFQNESSNEIILMKMRLICMKMDLQVKLVSFSYEWFHMKTCFDIEAKGYSEMAS